MAEKVSEKKFHDRFRRHFIFFLFIKGRTPANQKLLPRKINFHWPSQLLSTNK